MSEDKKYQIRNSTAEFLIFTKQASENTIEVRDENETVWLTQKLMGVLFEVTVPTTNEHLANIYTQGELSNGATIRNFRTVHKEVSREVTRKCDIHENRGKITQEIAKAFAESEFEKYRLVQDRLFESDFDRYIKQVIEPDQGGCDE